MTDQVGSQEVICDYSECNDLKAIGMRIKRPQTSYKVMANAKNDLVDRGTVCMVQKTSSICTTPGSVTKQVKTVYSLMMAAQQTGIRSMEKAIQARDLRNDRAKRARCTSLAEQLQTPKPGSM